ncbi:MAG: hypothetical protein C5B45_01885 [Chlamydiae bacterium]|nr:MAG: hypothetical protein C5B45_01885 [Chlamydiota bacterium]
MSTFPNKCFLSEKVSTIDAFLGIVFQISKYMHLYFLRDPKGFFKPCRYTISCINLEVVLIYKAKTR